MHGCTVIARNYLAHACVLAESFRAHNSSARFSVLVVDDPDGTLSIGEPFDVLKPADIGIDVQELNRRATMYTAQGLVASLKPHLLIELLSRGDGSVLLLDADGCVYSDLTPVATLAEGHSLVLSPHTLDPHPLPLADMDSPEQIILRAGVMNAGFLGVGRSAGSFLRWWAERTARRCVFDAQRGLMLSQTWLTLATALFDHHVLRDRGCNVAGWNLQARDVQWEDEMPTIDGVPLRHFHFAGSFDPEQPHLITPNATHASWWPSLEERPGTARLAREYAGALIARGYRKARAAQPLYDVMPGGAPIEPWMRTSYRTALVEAEQAGTAEPPNPFSDGAERFSAWLERRMLQRLEGEIGVSLDLQDPNDAGLDEILAAVIDGRRLLARVHELEGIRDEAVAWAEREAADLRYAVEVIAEREARIEALNAELADTMVSVGSVSRPSGRGWTKPLRLMRASAASAATMLRRSQS